jgi:hypothetical protein
LREAWIVNSLESLTRTENAPRVPSVFGLSVLAGKSLSRTSHSDFFPPFAAATMVFKIFLISWALRPN